MPGAWPKAEPGENIRLTMPRSARRCARSPLSAAGSATGASASCSSAQESFGGHVMNHKKLYRLYRDEGLSVRRRRGRKRARGSRTPMPVPLRPNDRWSMDFVADTFGASRRLRILAINDDACRENLCLLGDTSISGARVARELDALVRLYGKPACIVSDNVLGQEVAAENGQQVSLRRLRSALIAF